MFSVKGKVLESEGFCAAEVEKSELLVILRGPARVSWASFEGIAEVSPAVGCGSGLIVGSGGLDDFVISLQLEGGESLQSTAGSADLGIHRSRNKPITETNDNPPVVRGKIARPSGNPTDELSFSRVQGNFRPDRIAIAFCSLQFETDPGVIRAHTIAQ